MPADDVVMRIVIQDDGKTPPSSSGVGASSASGQSPAGAPQGSSPTYAQAAQFASQQPAGVHASIFSAGPATNRQAGERLPTATKATDDDPVREIAGSVARSVGVDNRLLLAALAARDYFKEKPPVAQIVQPKESLPEVTAAPRLVQVNKPVVPENLWAKRPEDWELAGSPAMKVNLPNQYPIRKGNLPGDLGDKMAPAVSAPVGPSPVGAAAKAATNVLPAVTAAAGGGGGAAGAGAAVTAASGGVAGISAIAAPVAIAVGAIAALTYAFTKATQHFIERGRELEKYSPELAGAGARQNIRDVQTDLREAQRMGGAYAGLSDQWGELKMILNELFLPFKQAIVESLTLGVRLFTDMIELIKPFIELAGGVLSMLGKVLHYLYDSALAGIEALIAIRDKLLGTTKTELPDPLKMFLNDATNQNGGARNRQADPLQRAADQRLNIPAFAGL